jgi:hypothetical protein
MKQIDLDPDPTRRGAADMVVFGAWFPNVKLTEFEFALVPNPLATATCVTPDLAAQFSNITKKGPF